MVWHSVHSSKSVLQNSVWPHELLPRIEFCIAYLWQHAISTAINNLIILKFWMTPSFSEITKAYLCPVLTTQHVRVTFVLANWLISFLIHYWPYLKSTIIAWARWDPGEWQKVHIILSPKQNKSARVHNFHCTWTCWSGYRPKALTLPRGGGR